MRPCDCDAPGYSLVTHHFREEVMFYPVWLLWSDGLRNLRGRTLTGMHLNDVNARAAVNAMNACLSRLAPYLHPRTSQGASPSSPSGGPTTWSSWYCDCEAQRAASTVYSMSTTKISASRETAAEARQAENPALMFLCSRAWGPLDSAANWTHLLVCI